VLLQVLPLLDLGDQDTSPSNAKRAWLSSLFRNLVSRTAKEALIKQVMKSSMVRGMDHGPVITLNRVQIKRGRDGFIGQGGFKSVFAQAAKAMSTADSKVFRLPNRVWKVKFMGEGLDDIGGGYSDSISEMCNELQTGALPLLVQTPNGRDHVGVNQDCFLVNSTCNSEAYLKVS
jgi:E3 ubiquitin-protein ligase HERC2